MKPRRNPSRGKRKFKKGLQLKTFTRPGRGRIERNNAFGECDEGGLLARMLARTLFRREFVKNQATERGN